MTSCLFPFFFFHKEDEALPEWGLLLQETGANFFFSELAPIKKGGKN